MKIMTDKEKTNLKKIGENIRQAREMKKLSYREFSAICGIDYSKISKIEKGSTNISALTIIRIAEALEIPSSQIFVGI
jgi:transcriptional regulator with XRE-family HTH domain